MNCLSNNDMVIFEGILQLSQQELQKTLHKFLKKYYKRVICKEQFLIAEGDIPIALVAHMDTVFKTPPGDILYDRKKNMMIATNGLGADDRAGVFAIIKIIKAGFRPHIIFTTDEEVGCVGASALAEYKNPFSDLRYMIQLDRRNANDCVFYDCDNEEFESYVEKFGFVKAWGSFSDICEICPEWKVAGVNLSIGYRDEHTVSEVLFVGQMLDTIEKVKKMLSEKDIPSFEFVPYVGWYDYGYYFGNKSYYADYPTDEDYKVFDPFYPVANYRYQCVKCKKTYMGDSVIPVKLIKGGKGYYCPECIDTNVEWCWKCGDAYELDPNSPITGYCKECENK